MVDLLTALITRHSNRVRNKALRDGALLKVRSGNVKIDDFAKFSCGLGILNTAQRRLPFPSPAAKSTFLRFGTSESPSLLLS